MKNIVPQFVMLAIIILHIKCNGQEIFDSINKDDIDNIKRIILADEGSINTTDQLLNTPLHYSVLNNNKELTEFLIKHHANLEAKNRYGRTPLLNSIIRNSEQDILKLLIDSGCNINTKDNGQNSPIEQANQRGMKDIVNLLLNKKVQIPEHPDKRTMMLTYAVFNGHKIMVDTLLSLGVNLKQSNLSDGSLLHTAALGGQTNMLMFLMEHSFDINLKDRYGYTPLHYAVLSGNISATKLLIAKGADINAKAYNNKTPFYLSTTNSEVKEFLLNVGVDTSEYSFPDLSEDYPDNNIPDKAPRIFSPGIISELEYEHAVPAISADMNEIYWSHGYDKIMKMVKVGGHWQKPEVASFSLPSKDADIVFSHDGNRLYFLSTRDYEGNPQSGQFNIWYVEKEDQNWSKAKPLEKVVNSYNWNRNFSFSEERNLYIGGSDIYLVKFSEGEYCAPVKLSAQINSESSEFSPYIDPEERFIVFTRIVEGGGYPFISFRDTNGKWSKAEKLSNYVDNIDEMFSFNISLDGKYFFFTKGQTSDMDIYWMSTDALKKIYARLNAE